MNDDVESLARTMREIWHTSDVGCPSDWNSSSFQEDWRTLARYILENFDPKGAAEKRPEDTRWQLGPCTYSNGESGRIVCLDRQYEDGEHGYPILSVSDKGKVIPHRQDGTAWANPLFNLKGKEDAVWTIESVFRNSIPSYKEGPLRLTLYAFDVDIQEFSPGQSVRIVPVE